ncbi:hypothetical protein Apa02nite_057240 [Actinoplanes palleronii]|uniref:Uncharacterized protein n=1 Tax=Actinoplanes palleronii TaxID=113570 RepID=A0ABQ4BG06_9ACTN|nr:hypothetical protein Apa02nite_057240 [Actinoplanes palleronii]
MLTDAPYVNNSPPAARPIPLRVTPIWYEYGATARRLQATSRDSLAPDRAASRPPRASRPSAQ